MSGEFGSVEATRREVLRKGVFVAPAILTLAAVPSFASAGSDGGEGKYKEPKEKYKEPKEEKDPKPPKIKD